MRVPPKDFQTEAVAQLKHMLQSARGISTSTPTAVLLNAPTGAGKTLILTTLIDELIGGSEEDGSEGDASLAFVWLTDQPELNKQTYDKMLATSNILGSSQLVIIDSAFDMEVLTPGHVYFLNTQKLGTATSFVRTSDSRTFTLWDSLRNTIAANPAKFILVIDEAHRGTKGRDVAEADTIVQKFMKGDREIDAVPLVIGISATPDRFVKLCLETNRPLFRVDVDPADVRMSGLLKEYVDLYNPAESQPADATLLRQAVESWARYKHEWAEYCATQHETVPSPVLLVQVADAKGRALSATDLGMVVETLAAEWGQSLGDGRWLAHAFQEGSEVAIGGQHVRYIAPSDIDRDPDVRAVLFKTSLNTGWDCPRAETMISFRTAKDETNIAQLVGRMVRAPLARRIDANDHLNSVSLYLPYYDRENVKRVIARLSTDVDAVPPTTVREGRRTLQLHRSAEAAECFAALAQLPSYVIPRVRPMKPVTRLARLAELLAALSLRDDPVKDYRARLVRLLLDERERLGSDAKFRNLVHEAGLLAIYRQRVQYGAGNVEGSPTVVQTEIADENVDDVYAEAGRQLGEGLHREYLRARLKQDSDDSRRIKLELYALVISPGVVTKVESLADEIRMSWADAHKAAIRESDERSRQTLREIAGAGSEPEEVTIDAPHSLEGAADGTPWRGHLFVDDGGNFYETFKSSWERRALETEIARPDVAGWLRNPDRKAWSLCVPRRYGTKWAGIYPDFLVFRKTATGIIADIVDPHLLADENAPERAAALAHYAQKHAEHFGRIELLIYEDERDAVGKRLDLVDDRIRARVAHVTSHQHLRQVFEML